MPEPLHLLYAALAGWRLAVMLHSEYGPLDVFARIRNLAGIYDGDRPDTPRPFIGDLLECMACLTVWTTGGMVALGALVSWWIPAVGAAMALALFLHTASLVGTRYADYLKSAIWRNS